MQKYSEKKKSTEGLKYVKVTNMYIKKDILTKLNAKLGESKIPEFPIGDTTTVGFWENTKDSTQGFNIKVDEEKFGWQKKQGKFVPCSYMKDKKDCWADFSFDESLTEMLSSYLDSNVSKLP